MTRWLVIAHSSACDNIETLKALASPEWAFVWCARYQDDHQRYRHLGVVTFCVVEATP